MGLIRILLVDDHQVMRQGLRSLLDLEQEIQVVGEAGTGTEALQLIDQTHPDIVLLDLKLTDMSGTEVCRRVTAQYPEIAVLILTAISSGQEVLECVDAGAKGYLLKDVDVDELTRTIRAIHHGESVLDPKVTQAVLQRARGLSPDSAPALTLTDQERGIVRLIAQGFTNKEIGEKMFLSPNTVKFHISDIMQKLKVKRRAEVAFKAAGEHLI
ncbi:MAG: response regulator transcription factor [Chloroflexi bacterium]|nr:response regulator transcription factor [Chloroflexota bacterium]